MAICNPKGNWRTIEWEGHRDCDAGRGIRGVQSPGHDQQGSMLGDGRQNFQAQIYL